jgi:hypothetical protein
MIPVLSAVSELGPRVRVNKFESARCGLGGRTADGLVEYHLPVFVLWRYHFDYLWFVRVSYKS